MRILSLCERMDLAPAVARLHLAQWGHLRPNDPLEARLARLAADCGPSGVPSAYVAMEGDDVVGTAMLVASDMDTRPELTPWLAGVYVVPERRRGGLGSLLVTRVEDEARAAGVARLLLYTPDMMPFYRTLGWREIEVVAYRGQDVTIMCKDL